MGPGYKFWEWESITLRQIISGGKLGEICGIPKIIISPSDKHIEAKIVSSIKAIEV